MKRKRETAGTREINTLNPYAFFGDYYACVFEHLCLCGLKFKEEGDYVQVEFIFLFFLILLFNPK